MRVSFMNFDSMEYSKKMKSKHNFKRHIEERLFSGGRIARPIALGLGPSP